MAQIRILDSETIDKIAAGEVVERPSSVVKELVENAIDAGATAITVEAKEGGIEFLRVTDNGCGMEKSQLRTAFFRHATSKIRDVRDLNQISSLGFRGEALSSISAVSKVEVITKTAESITGTRICLEGASEIAFEEIGAPDGTTFIMRNLFFNTPVRRKFLKQPMTEGGYIADLMEHLALSRPDISFKLLLNNQMKFHTSGNGDLREVIYRIYGRDVASSLIPIKVKENGISVEGYLGKPVLVRSNRNLEIYFINGRFIRSSVIAKAIEEGYKEYLMQHKFPMCVLHITMDPESVDVNVHPTKMDVRFSNPNVFGTFLMNAVREALKMREMIPEASLSTVRELKEEAKQEHREKEKAHTPEPFEKNRGSQYRVMEQTRYEAKHHGLQETIHNPVWNRVKSVFAEESALSDGKAASLRKEDKEEAGKAAVLRRVAQTVAESHEEFGTPSGQMKATGCDAKQADGEGVKGNAVDSIEKGITSADVLREEKEDVFFEETSEIEPDTVGKENVVTEDASQISESESASTDVCNGAGVIQEEPTPTGTQMNLFEEKILTADNRSRFRIIGQVFETYWLIEFEEKLLMVDQHAAHEKVNYERMMARFREKNVTSQRLMPPVIVSLSAQEEIVLKEHLEVFAGLGFEIEEFGGSEYALRSVPVDLYGCNEREMFLEVLDELGEGGNWGGIRVVEEKIASMSCKAAVKGNSRLSFAEAENLIDELLTLENPYNCPHGRPTIVSMTKAEVERKFKRIVN